MCWVCKDGTQFLCRAEGLSLSASLRDESFALERQVKQVGLQQTLSPSWRFLMRGHDSKKAKDTFSECRLLHNKEVYGSPREVMHLIMSAQGAVWSCNIYYKSWLAFLCTFSFSLPPNPLLTLLLSSRIWKEIIKLHSCSNSSCLQAGLGEPMSIPVLCRAAQGSHVCSWQLPTLTAPAQSCVQALKTSGKKWKWNEGDSMACCMNYLCEREL